MAEKNKENSLNLDSEAKAAVSEPVKEEGGVTGQKDPKNLSETIKKAVEGLWYSSETDAEIESFSASKVDVLNKDSFAGEIKNSKKDEITEKSFDDFFAPLIEIQDWYGDEEKQTAARFAELKDLLKKNLSELKCFKVGKIEIDVYVVGLDGENILTGIQTKSVET